MPDFLIKIPVVSIREEPVLDMEGNPKRGPDNKPMIERVYEQKFDMTMSPFGFTAMNPVVDPPEGSGIKTMVYLSAQVNPVPTTLTVEEVEELLANAG